MSKHSDMVGSLVTTATKPKADAVPAGSVKCPRCRVTVEVSRIAMKDRCHSACPLNKEDGS